jgi:hypothetical protein
MHLLLEAEKFVVDMPGIVNLSIVDTVVLANIYSDPEILLQAYSLNSMEPMGTILKKGEGPDEFLHTNVSIQFTEDSTGCKFWGYDSNLRLFYLLNITKTIEEQRTVIEKKYDLRKLGFNGQWIYVSDSLLLATNWTIDNMEVFTYNPQKDQITYRTQLFDVTHNTSLNHIHAFSHILDVKPDLSKIVIDMLYLNQLHIISLNNTEDRVSFSTSKHPGNFEQIIRTNTADLVTYYKDIRVTDRFIFANYTPHSLRDENDITKTVIHVFDWEGNPVARIDMPHYTPYFAIDEKRGFLYGLSEGDSFTEQEILYRYDLTELLKN